MNIKYIFGLLTAILVAGYLLTSGGKSIAKDEVAIMQIVDHPALNITRKGIEDHLSKCCSVNVIYENAQGDTNLGMQIARKFLQKEPKVIVTIGTLAAQMFLKNNNIPVIFSSVTDPVYAGLVKSFENTETNFSGVSNMTSVLPQLKFFQSVYPRLKKMGVIYNTGEANSIKLVSLLKKGASELGIEIVEASSRSSSEVINAAQNVAREVDSIFITNDNTALSSLGGIIKAANVYKIPVFCSDNDTIGTGVLATFGPDQYEIGKQTGMMVERILKGEKVDDLPVSLPNKINMKIDIKVAEKLKINLDKKILEDSDMVVEG